VQIRPDRIAMAAAIDDREALVAVLQLIDTLGFDPVGAGRLEAGLALQPGGPVFGAGHTNKELSSLLEREAASARLDHRLMRPRMASPLEIGTNGDKSLPIRRSAD